MLSPRSTRKTKAKNKSEDTVVDKQRSNILVNASSGDECIEKLCRTTISLFQESPKFLDEDIFFVENCWEDILKEKLSPRARLQQSALWEFLVTERTYIMRLKIVVELFMKTLRRMQAEGNLLEFHEANIFANIQDVLKVNERFWVEYLLPVLKRVRKDGRRIFPSDLLRSNGNDVIFIPMFAAYEIYCFSEDVRVKFVHDTSESTMNSFGSPKNLGKKDASSNERFRLWLNHCQSLISCDRLKLENLLSEPRLRLIRYNLLFSEIRKHTSKPEEVILIERFLNACEDCLRRIDKSMEDKVKKKELMACLLELEEETIMEINEAANSYYIDFLCLPINTKSSTESRYILDRTSLNVIKESKREKIDAFLFSDVLFLAKLNNENKKYTIVSRPYFLHKLNVVKSKKVTKTAVVLYLDDFGLLADTFSIELSNNKLDRWIATVEKAKLCFSNVTARSGSTLDYFSNSSHSSESYDNKRPKKYILGCEPNVGECIIADSDNNGIGYYDVEALPTVPLKQEMRSTDATVNVTNRPIGENRFIKVSSQYEADCNSSKTTDLYSAPLSSPYEQRGHITRSKSARDYHRKVMVGPFMRRTRGVEKETQTDFVTRYQSSCSNRFCYLVNHVCD